MGYLLFTQGSALRRFLHSGLRPTPLFTLRAPPYGDFVTYPLALSAFLFSDIRLQKDVGIAARLYPHTMPRCQVVLLRALLTLRALPYGDFVATPPSTCSSLRCGATSHADRGQDAVAPDLIPIRSHWRCRHFFFPTFVSKKMWGSLRALYAGGAARLRCLSQARLYGSCATLPPAPP